jgi:hypothetical protein
MSLKEDRPARLDQPENRTGTIEKILVRSSTTTIHVLKILILI